jgi:hypothetical protein
MNLNNPFVIKICWILMIAFSCVFWYFAFQGFDYAIDLIFKFINN